ncbi:MAG: T9SS type A sorting domain-containing protein [Bacteroidales bacterium]|nr:T9SS type A sorting domain-containing protein [Bacteroidales bacterium]
MKKITLTLASLLLMGWAMAQSGNHWTVITGTQYNMTVKGIIVIDGVTQANNQLEIGAFCGDECRGSRTAALFPPTGEYPVMLTVVSNVYSGETITFRIYDHATQKELDLESESTLTFEHNTNQGSMGSWFPFVFTTPPSSTIHNTTSGSWNDPNSWGGTMPTASATVAIDVNCVVDGDVEVANLSITDGAILTIQAGNVLTVTGELINANEAGLVIQDGAQLINGSANVKATLQKDITAYSAKSSDGWYAIGSPVDNMAIEGSDFLTPAYDLYRYNENPESGLEWENYKDSTNVNFTTFENGRGYLYANSNTFSPTFVGTLNAAPVERTLSCSENPDGLSGFNLIGNPFPHAIYKGEGGAIDDGCLASGYYTLDNESTWHTHTYEDAIMPGQGILVKTTTAKDLTITKSNTAATTESSNAKASVRRLDLKVYGKTGEDRAFVYFGQGIGLEKMNGLSDQVPNLWIREQNNDYAIAHLDNTCESLDIYFSNKLEADFTLAVNTRDTNFSYLQLIDNITESTVDLLQQPNYTFHAIGNEINSRFKLVFKVATGVQEAKDETSFAYVNNGNIILVGADREADLRVFDMTGRAVPSEGLKPGVYVLHLMNGDTMKTQKIVIK